MSINLSFRNSTGQFIDHKTVLNSFACKLAGIAAIVLFEKTARFAINKAEEYIKEKAQKAADKAADKTYSNPANNYMRNGAELQA